MSNDTTLNIMSGGDKFRDFDDGTRKWPAGFIAFGAVSDPGPIAAPTVVSSANPLPITGTISVSGAVLCTPSGTQTVTVANTLTATTSLNVYGVTTLWGGIRLDDQTTAGQVDVSSVGGRPLALDDLGNLPVSLAKDEPKALQFETAHGDPLLRAVSAANPLPVQPNIQYSKSLLRIPDTGISALQGNAQGSAFVDTQARLPCYARTTSMVSGVTGGVLFLAPTTKAVSISRIICEAVNTTTTANSIGYFDYQLIEYSTLYTGGTVSDVSSSIFTYNPNDPAPSATLKKTTVAVTQGTQLAFIRSGYQIPGSITCPAVALVFDWTGPGIKKPQIDPAINPGYYFGIAMDFNPANTAVFITIEWLEGTIT